MKICKTCSRSFEPSSRHLKCPACRNQDAKHPCAICGVLIKRTSERCVRCNNSARSGVDSPTWKGGRTIHKRGYVQVHLPAHPRADSGSYIFEHIVVMEEKLNRYLLPNENVHHINGVKDDNRIENLELWTRPQPSGARVKDLVVWAKQVLKQYEPESLKENT